MIIANALKNGQDIIEIMRNGMVCEIRLEQNLECHFATNKMRPIRRIKALEDEHVHALQKNAIPQYADDFDNEFDALSNNLDALANSHHPSHATIAALLQQGDDDQDEDVYEEEEEAVELSSSNGDDD